MNVQYILVTVFVLLEGRCAALCVCVCMLSCSNAVTSTTCTHKLHILLYGYLRIFNNVNTCIMALFCFLFVLCFVFFFFFFEVESALTKPLHC